MKYHPQLRNAERLARLLDSQFRLPGTNWRFGLDGLVGLFAPGAGDTITAALGLYIIVTAHRLGAPATIILRMLINLAVDWLVGSIPILGDIFDFAFKAHRRNLALLRRHLLDRAEEHLSPNLVDLTEEEANKQ